VSDAAFDAVKTRFGLDGALELLALSGYYSLMAMVLNTAGLPLPDNAPPPLAP
jgi:4-carboxymuconolactone decarboxylase